MIAIRFRFPGGRYHATPWDHHVNEGVVEWPPSPWRILRAVIATWHRKATTDIGEDVVRAIVEALASELPEFSLPRAVAAHTRHYMPQYKSGDTSKIFDAFLHLDPDAHIDAIWSGIDLEPDQQAALALLLDRMAYLGRAESWVEASLVADPAVANAAVVPGDGAVPDGSELVRVLAPVPAPQYTSWCAGMLDELLTRRLAAVREKKGDGAKLSKADRRNAEAAVPTDLYAALHQDTGDIRKQGWSRAPGSRWLDYVRPTHLIRTAAPLRRRPSGRAPTVARYAVASTVPPRLTQSLALANRVRQSLLKHSDGHSVFAGRDAHDKRLLGHRHVFILPEANDGSGRVTHVTLYARDGFDDAARRAVTRVTNVWGHGGHHTNLVLIGFGEHDDFAGLDEQSGSCPLLCEATSWVSRTPFVPTRHPKHVAGGVPKLDASGMHIGSPAHDLVRLLTSEGFPTPSGIESVSGTLLRRQTSWHSFSTQRNSGGGARAGQRGFGFRLEFDVPITGPVVVGYGAHFGLGQFVPSGVY